MLRHLQFTIYNLEISLVNNKLLPLYAKAFKIYNLQFSLVNNKLLSLHA